MEYIAVRQTDTSAIWSALTYDDAKRLHDSAKPHTNAPDRVLGHKRQTQLGIRMWEGNVVYRFHETDVVTFYPDGRVMLRAWESRATDDVVRAILPRCYVEPWYMCPAGHAVIVGDAVYKLAGMRITLRTGATSQDAWTLEDAARDTEPWEKVVIDQKKMRALYKTSGFDTYKAWARMRERLLHHRELKDGSSAGWRKIRDFDLLALQNPKQYEILSSAFTIEQLRMALLSQAEGVATVTTVPHVTRAGIASLKANRTKYGFLL